MMGVLMKLYKRNLNINTEEYNYQVIFAHINTEEYNYQVIFAQLCIPYHYLKRNVNLEMKRIN